MLEEEGAVALRCPLVQIADLEDTSQAEDWIEQLIAAKTLRFHRPADRRWPAQSRDRPQRGKKRDDFIRALAKSRIVTRGPKPARALREIGLVPALTASEPTSAGILDTLKKKNLQGRRIGVQLCASL